MKAHALIVCEGSALHLSQVRIRRLREGSALHLLMLLWRKTAKKSVTIVTAKKFVNRILQMTAVPADRLTAGVPSQSAANE